MVNRNKTISLDNHESEKVSINVSFCVFSTICFTVFSVVNSGAQDILAGTHTQTSTILLADIGPCLFAALVLPYFIDRIPYVVRVVAIALCHFISFMIIGLADNVYMKLFGVSLATFAMGVGEISSLSLTSHFKPSVLSWYSTGAGAGFIMGPLYYTAFTTWLGVSSNITFIILGPCSVLFLVCYYFIQKEITKDEQKPMERNDVYSKLASSENDESDDLKSRPETNQIFAGKGLLTFKEKISAVKEMLSLIGVAHFVVFFAEYIILESVVTTIAYPNAPFQPRDHYQYYSLALMIGELLGRSHRSVLGILKPSWLYSPTPLQLWVLTAIEALHLMFFFHESWFRFLPGVGVPVFLCLTGGTVAGIVFISGIELVRSSFVGKKQEFVLLASMLPMDFGMVMAALIGLYVEPRLREHCISITTNAAYCFTRLSNLEN